MEVTELLSFKPNKILSRNEDDDQSGDKMPPKKVRRVDKSSWDLDSHSTNVKRSRLQLQGGTAISSGKKSILTKRNPAASTQVQQEMGDLSRVATVVTNHQETQEERQMRLLDEVESRMDKKDQQLDEHTVKKLILSFEKKACKNQEMRIKHMDNPERFMESELDLNDAIMEMRSLSTMPNHYHYLVELNAAKTLLGLLSHQNADISTSVIDLLQELTDNDDPLDEDDREKDGINLLISTLISSKLCALLVQNLERLDESVEEEASGVYNSLSLLENILELKPKSTLTFASEGLLAWLLKRLRAKLPFSTNKLYASEILSIMLQNDEMDIKQQLGESDGIDTILQQLAAFKRHDPSSLDEIEFMENMFNCLCAALSYSLNRDRFLNGEGLQLMNLMLREKKISRNSALKVLDHAMTGADGTSNCAKFVDILGLRTLFPLFMKPPKKNKKIGSTVKDHEEHIVCIIASMLQNLKGSQRQRLVLKFSEQDFAKIERLMEMHFKYLQRVQIEEKLLEENREKLLDLVDGDEDELEEDFYVRRLEVGLYTLQQVDYIIVDLSAASSSIKQRVLRLLNLKNGSVKAVRGVLREYANKLDDKASSAANVFKQKILSLADKF